jgi:type IX secretion system PorP/SprF family membrane protein
MKRFLLKTFLLSLLAVVSATAQDIPLFSQKLTNSFIYNPALAGHTYGSITYSFKQNYKVDGAPQNHFLSAHTPIANHRFGIGASVYQEDVTFLRNLYASAAFAYHIPLSKITTLSFGLAGEYNAFNVNGALNFDDGDDSELRAYQKGIGEYDFSFGAHFQNRFIKAGLASNRLSTAWIKDSSKTVLSNYYSSFVQGLIPLRAGQDILEPYVAFRKLSDVNTILDIGVFYTFDNKIILGGSMRNQNIISGTVGFRLSKYLMVGYSREMITGNVGGFIGAANEFSFRFDFNENNYKERFSADYKSSVAYRRKTMSGPVGKSGSRSPKQIQKKQKKLAPYSPNSRYQNIKKLSVKSKAGKKPSAGKKRRKTNNYRKKHKRRR